MAYTGDKEYLILSQIDGERELSQRDLSRRTGLSLGTVNILLKKMTREGLVKMESIPANRVVYMLTPKGIMEKAEKTLRYVKRHYAALSEARAKMREALSVLLAAHEQLYVLVPDDEMGHLVRLAVQELGAPGVVLIRDPDEVGDAAHPLVICDLPPEIGESGRFASMPNPVVSLVSYL